MLQRSYEYLRHGSVSDTLGCGSELRLNFNDMLAKAATCYE